ncbi:MAG: glycogen/starch/alpha-glucan phosphorylase [Acidobacteriota bacterium]
MALGEPGPRESTFFTDSVRRSGFSLRNQFAEHMEFGLVKTRLTATEYDYYLALSMAVKDRLVRRWLRTQQTYAQQDARRVYYLSLEFLMGRLLANTLINMDYYEECREIIREDGLILEDLMEVEYDMGLGNGGLGRLAACYLDSLATLRIPACGYGIRYEFGIFRQEIRNGYQVEQPDNWLHYGNPWETVRPELSYRVRFFGRVETWRDPEGRERFRWVDTEDVLAVAWDIPVPGYKSDTVNNLRLWSAKATHEFSFSEFDRGNYLAAVEDKYRSENISKVLYPNDSSMQGKLLRLQQEYFFVSASLQDILAAYRLKHDDCRGLAEKIFIQLNDTHPSLGIPELMRILLDEEGLGWDEAWDITTRCFGYTNHTVVPEALEEWPVDLFGRLLPRHLQIIYEINQRFLDGVRRDHGADDAMVAELSLIREWPVRAVRMANLAIVGSRSVNGVAALHTEILKTRIFPHFHRIFPDKFHSITNGITPRRWLKVANPLLAQCITERIGGDWVTDLAQLRRLEPLADDPEFRAAWANIKKSQRILLKRYIEKELDVAIDVDSLFDSQVKRFHLYKRQLLNILRVVADYLRLRRDPQQDYTPRTVIFSGKAAPAYHDAKLVIKLIHEVAARVNRDPAAEGRLKVIFLPNYSVSLAEKIIPASDLSEQISTAGFEASGTGNMKFALNGALTIGTMDGANIEIRDEVGAENMFIFGLGADEVVRLKASGYRPRDFYERSPRLRETLDAVAGDFFNPDEPGIFASLVEELLERDFYCVLADFDAFLEAQEKAARVFRDPDTWHRMSILNVARIGRFSSDRSIREYNEKIWHVPPVEIPEEAYGMI